MILWPGLVGADMSHGGAASACVKDARSGINCEPNSPPNGISEMTLRQIIWLFPLVIAVAGCGDSNEEAAPAPRTTSAVQTDAESGASSESIPPIVPDEERGFETPEAAYAAYAAAKKGDDYAAFMNSMTVESQKATAGATIFGVGMMAAFDETLKDSVTALFKKHGMPDQSEMQGPPPGITEDSTKIEQMAAMGSFFDNPAAFVIEARNFIEQQPNTSNNSGEASGELGEIIVDGDSASATVRHRRGRQQIAFCRTSGGWLVQLTNDQFTPNSGRTFSGSGKTDRFSMRDRNPDMLPPVEPITIEEVQNSWKVSVDYQKQSAISALQDITQKCGLTIFDELKFAEPLAKKVTVTLNDVAPVEVIEAVCSAVDLHPRYKAGAMAFNEGPRTLPATFAGPFVVEATETQELVPNAYGMVKFQAFAAGLPTAVTARLNGLQVRPETDQQKATLGIPDLKGSDGSNLGTRFRSFTPVQASKSSVQLKGTVDVEGLLRAVTSIAEFDGSVSWLFPQKIESAILETLAKDATATVGTAKITVTRVNLNSTSSSVAFDLEGITHKDLLVTAYDKTGAACKQVYVSGYSNNGKSMANVSARGEIAKLDIRTIVESERVTFPYRFPSIPLAYFDDMPDVLPELEIDGDVPVSIEFKEFVEQNGVRMAKFHWANKTNKDIHMILVSVEYVDAAGKVLQSRESRPSGNRIMLDFGESEETNLIGQSVPEGAVSGKATLKSIEFVDGTEWNADGD